MHNSNLNNRSLHSARMKNFMQQGGQPQQEASPNDPMEQLVPAIKSALEQGMPLAQLILTMAQNNIPMDIIQQGLAVAGIPEQEIMGAMNELQQEQQQSQQQAPAEGPIQPTEGMPAEGQPKMPAVDQVQEGQPRMAQDGAEVGGDEIDYSAPVEDVVTDYGDGYHYKKITDPSTGEMTYFTKSAKGKKWRDLQQPGNETPLLSTRAGVFGDNVDEWEGTKAQADYQHKREMEKLKEIEAYKARKAQKELEARNASGLKDANNIVPSYTDITKDGSGYYTKVIQYPKGDKKMLPGHIESVLMYRDPNDPKSKPRIIQQWMDNDGNLHDAIVNRWESKGQGVHQFGNDSGGDDNAGVAGVDKDGKKIYQAHAGHLRSMADLQHVLDSDKYIRTADIQLDSKGLGNYLNSAAKESGIDYHFENNNCADGVCRAFGIDDKNVGNTAGTEGFASWAADSPLVLSMLPEGASLKGGPGSLTDPQQVMDFILKNKNVTGRTGTRKNRSQGVQDMARDGLRNLGKQNGWSPETVEALQSGASVLIDGITYVYRGGRLIKQTAEKAVKAIDDAADYVVKNSKELTGGLFDLDVSPSKAWSNTKKWWGFQEGGEPGRYGSILNQAQYGMGIDNHLNFNQKFGQDDSFRSNINSAYMPMNLGMKGSNTNLLATVAEGAGRLFGAKDKDGDGLADGAFRDMKAKRNRHKDTMAVMKGKTPKGLMDNAGDKLMMKYDAETGNYQTAYNDPRYQSNIKKKKYSNLFKKGEKVNTGELVNKPFDYEKEGYKSFNQLQSDMSGLDQNQKDQLKYVSDQRSLFETDKKDMPKGMQFGMDEKGGVGYYDKDAALPKDSQENLNKMMMQDYKNGGSFNNPGFKALPESVQQKIMSGIQKGQDGKEIMGEIMEAEQMPDDASTEAIVRQYEAIIRRMQQQHAMEMQQLMMQMQQGQQGRMEQDTRTLPPMQMGGDGESGLIDKAKNALDDYLKGNQGIIPGDQTELKKDFMEFLFYSPKDREYARKMDSIPPENWENLENYLQDRHEKEKREALNVPPMQMGGGFGLPFAQEGGEREPSIFNTGGATDLPEDPPGTPQPLAGKKRFHKFVKPDAMVGDSDWANIDKSGLSEEQLGIVNSAEFKMDPRSFRGQVPGKVMRTQRKANKAIMEPGQGFSISKPQHEKYNWKLNAKLHGQDQERDRQRAREAGITGDALEGYGRKERGSGFTFGRERDTPNEFTKVGKFMSKVKHPFDKDKQIQHNPTRFWNLTGGKIKQGGGMVESQMQPNMMPDPRMMDPRMMEMQYMNDTAQQMMNPEVQAEMMQQTMSPDQLMQMQQYLQQLIQEIQEASPKGRSYKKPSPHDMDTVELSTEQIAKIMAAGGSVKIL